jgi:hypothetical protein
MNRPREMDAQERETRIRDRVDQVLDQRPPVGDQIKIFPSKWNDLQSRFYSAKAGNPVTLKAGTIDEMPTTNLFSWRFEDEFSIAAVKRNEARLGKNAPAISADDVRKCARDQGVIDNSCLGHKKTGDPGRVRLNLPDFIRPKPSKSLEAIGQTAALEFP